MLSKKATKIEEIFTNDLTLCSKCQIGGEDFVNFCGPLEKHELYIIARITVLEIPYLDVYKRLGILILSWMLSLQN